MSDESLRYPIGRFAWNGPSAEQRLEDIKTIAMLPERLREVVEPLSGEQLDTPYRPDGWSVRQVVHHLADSHSNSLFRFKLALTEDTPTIPTYDEAAWARLADYDMPVAVSLSQLTALHARWVALLRSLSDSDFERQFIHPEWEGTQNLEWLLALYGWHSQHHLAHVTSLGGRMGW